MLSSITPRWPLFKEPKTDEGTKTSAKGFLDVYEIDYKFILKDNMEYDEWVSEIGGNALRVVYYDGTIMTKVSLETLRRRLRA